VAALRLEILVVHQDLAALDRTLAGERLDELALTVAGNPGDADDLARADLQIETGDRFAAFVVFDKEPGDLQDLVVVGRLRPRGGRPHDRVADHHGRHFPRRELADFAPADLGAAPEHADVIAERLDLAELVGDHQRSDLAAVRHVLEQPKDLVGFARRQDGGRLVEDQKPLIEIEQLQDLELLLLARRERRHRPVERHAERHAGQEGLEPIEFLPPVDHRGRVGAAGDEILGRRQRGHEGEMLIDHADSERLRVARILHVDFSLVEQKGSLVRGIEAHHAFNEGRLARAVLAQKRMKRARGDLDRHIVERSETPESLGHSYRFE
jgi:hypothetical protein